LHQEVTGDAITFLREAYPRKFSVIETIPTTRTEIKSTVHSLSANGLTNTILRVLNL
jgi:transcription-repair coupling factor (superfamily II helicase)